MSPFPFFPQKPLILVFISCIKQVEFTRQPRGATRGFVRLFLREAREARKKKVEGLAEGRRWYT
jgi:hypothetical protein